MVYQLIQPDAVAVIAYKQHARLTMHGQRHQACMYIINQPTLLLTRWLVRNRHQRLCGNSATDHYHHSGSSDGQMSVTLTGNCHNYA